MADKKEQMGAERKRIFASKRYRIMLWCAFVSLLIGSTATFAWYGSNEKKADSEAAEVMKPYYLTLLNPSETDTLQLAVGNLFPGNKKQVVFCVSNKDNEKTGLDMGVTSFEYSIELIHTQNLALVYEIYELEKGTEDTPGAIAALDEITDDSGNVSNTTTYWTKKTATSLAGEDVSQKRHEAVGLTDPMPVNAGKYTAYKTASDNTTKLQLSAGTDASGNPTFDSQYFLLEIEWADGAESEFEKYEKETDMIYLLVEALQPKPEKKTAATE